MMEKVIEFLKDLHPLSSSLEAEPRNEFRFTKKRKNEFLLFEGEVCRHAWYLQKGLVWCYYNKEEDEVITWFAATSRNRTYTHQATVLFLYE